MTLQEIQQTYIKTASLLGDYQAMDKTTLANGYCDYDEAVKEDNKQNISNSENESLRSAYFAALVLRYWFKIYEWKQNSSSLHLQDTDYVDWLVDSLHDAFYYRGWRFEYLAKVKEGEFIEWKLDENGNKILNENYYKLDPNAPDKNINFFLCTARRGKEYQKSNKLKRKVNATTYSLDNMIDENGDCATAYAGATTEKESSNISNLIELLIKRGESLEALIIDGIANQDSMKVNKETIVNSDVNEDGEIEEDEYDKYSYSFDARKLVKHLNSINQSFVLSFCKTYNVEQVNGNELYNKLKSMNNTKLYKYIERTLLEVKSDKELLGCIM